MCLQSLQRRRFLPIRSNSLAGSGFVGSVALEVPCLSDPVCEEGTGLVETEGVEGAAG